MRSSASPTITSLVTVISPPGGLKRMALSKAMAITSCSSVSLARTYRFGEIRLTTLSARLSSARARVASSASSIHRGRQRATSGGVLRSARSK